MSVSDSQGILTVFWILDIVNGTYLNIERLISEMINIKSQRNALNFWHWTFTTDLHWNFKQNIITIHEGSQFLQDIIQNCRAAHLAHTLRASHCVFRHCDIRICFGYLTLLTESVWSSNVLSHTEDSLKVSRNVCNYIEQITLITTHRQQRVIALISPSTIIFLNSSFSIFVYSLFSHARVLFLFAIIFNFIEIYINLKNPFYINERTW